MFDAPFVSLLAGTLVWFFFIICLVKQSDFTGSVKRDKKENKEK
jgi:hypothetical protein